MYVGFPSATTTESVSMEENENVESKEEETVFGNGSPAIGLNKKVIIVDAGQVRVF
jgi:hypothetical protein